MTPSLHLVLIPILPLIGAAVNGLLGKRFSRQAVATVALAFCGAAFAMALWIALRFSSLPIPLTEYVAPWIRAGSFQADFAFYLDQLSLVMMLVVTGVGFLIHIYAVGYMWEEGGFYRFFSYLNLFMFFMLTLVLANNYLLMFIGWEGVGLASYLLIGFWFTKDAAAAAGKKAFIVNRIGDFGFLIALFLLIKHFGSLNFADVFGTIVENSTQYPVETAGAGLLTAIGLLLMVGAAGKSAQLPLYVWLPDAMEGPTPVSALIHAATMVTAGVYMVARSHVIFDRAPMALTVVAIVGTLTALFAATIGICQTDIKKVLAYSTISQLGYMFLACGVAASSDGIFHLMTGPRAAPACGRTPSRWPAAAAPPGWRRAAPAGRRRGGKTRSRAGPSAARARRHPPARGWRAPTDRRTRTPAAPRGGRERSSGTRAWRRRPGHPAR